MLLCVALGLVAGIWTTWHRVGPMFVASLSELDADALGRSATLATALGSVIVGPLVDLYARRRYHMVLLGLLNCALLLALAFTVFPVWLANAQDRSSVGERLSQLDKQVGMGLGPYVTSYYQIDIHIHIGKISLFLDTYVPGMFSCVLTCVDVVFMYTGLGSHNLIPSHDNGGWSGMLYSLQAVPVVVLALGVCMYSLSLSLYIYIYVLILLYNL